jgi:anti-sigma factor RsiW
MTDDTCLEMQLLVQADFDGELAPAEAARVAAHLQTCEACAALPARLAALSGGLRRDLPYHTAPDALRARIAAMAPAAPPPAPAAQAKWRRFSARAWLRPWQAVPFGAGFALAACLLLLLLPPGGAGLPDAVVASHIRALQPGHLTDVISTDQHTVKPWFDGRLDFAPPVLDLAVQGFPLEGGRLDYLAGHPAAVLVYGRRQHVINLYVWPERGEAGPVATSRSGYNMVRWNRNGMTFWAVSDLDAKELAEFVGDFGPS